MSTTSFTLPSARVASRRVSSKQAAWLGFAVVIVSSVMDLLDSTIAQTAAPAIRRDLGGSYADLEWITAAYTLAMAATLMLGGRLGDAFGRRRCGEIPSSVMAALSRSVSLRFRSRNSGGRG